MKVTIRDIAEKAGVSIGTVDRVLHDRGEVSPETRKRVLGIIHEMRYEPDILARILKTKKKFKIAILLPAPDRENLFWKDPEDGIRQALNDELHVGFSLIEGLYDQFDKSSFKRQANRVLREIPDALIMAPVFYQESMSFLDRCSSAGIPFVVINSNICHKDQLCFIGQDSLKSGQLAARLLSYGLDTNKNLVIINIASETDNYGHILNRGKGFLDFFAESPDYGRTNIIKINIDTTDDLVIHEYLSSEIRGQNSISGIFVTNSKVYKVARYLEENMSFHPHLIGYDLLVENTRYLKKGLIDFLISQRPKEQGYRGFISLFQYLVLGRKPEPEIYLPIDIIASENFEYYSK